MFEVRYAGVDRAAGYRGMLVQARAEHLWIDIQDSNHNSLVVDVQVYCSTMIECKN
jgi:hypothetical protein